MSNKSQVYYSYVFEYIHNNIIELNNSTFVTDYEKAMRNALKKLYPNAKFYNCHYHFYQAVKKKAYKLGLAVPIKNDVNV